MRQKMPIFLLIIWISFIFFNSLQPGIVSGANSGRIVSNISKFLNIFNLSIDYNTLSIMVRKGAHIFEYMILSVLFYLVFKNYLLTSKMFLIAIFSVTVAIVDESIQLFVEGRAGSLIDVGIDTIGVVIGLSICILIDYFRFKK